MHIHTYLTLTIRDSKGRLLARHQEISRSYLLAMADHLYIRLGVIAAHDIPDTAGINRTLRWNEADFMASYGLANQSDWGPVIGTDGTAVAIDDHALGAQITHGVGASQMQHALGILTAPTTFLATRRFTIQRVFTNNSGAPITVNESGLYCRTDDDATIPRYFCLIRDVLGAPQAVANLASATLTYTIEITA